MRTGMATDFGETLTRDAALRRAQDQLSEVLNISDALDEPLLAVHVSHALETTKSLLVEPARRT